MNKASFLHTINALHIHDCPIQSTKEERDQAASSDASNAPVVERTPAAETSAIKENAHATTEETSAVTEGTSNTKGKAPAVTGGTPAVVGRTSATPAAIEH